MAFSKLDRHHEAIVIALDVEDNPLRADDARRRIAPLHIRGAPPCRLADFVEPGIQCGLHRRLVLLAGEAFDELTQGAAGDYPHPPDLSRSPYGGKNFFLTAATRTPQTITTRPPSSLTPPPPTHPPPPPPPPLSRP